MLKRQSADEAQRSSSRELTASDGPCAGEAECQSAEAAGAAEGAAGVVAGGLTAGSVALFAAPIALAAIGLFAAANLGPKVNPKYLPKTGTSMGGAGRDRPDQIHPKDWKLGGNKSTTNVTVTVSGKSGGKASGPTRADFPSRH